MAHHDFVFSYETASDHVFTCSKCGVEIGFNKPGVGSPTADLSGPMPAFPTEGEAYVTPCEVE
jgi:hypothetical protein